MRGILGLGRKARHKIFPIVVIVLAFLWPIIFIGLAALFPIDIFADELRPEYWELARFPLVVMAIMLFSAMVVPEALVRDRRNGMLPLYLSTPLTRATYLLGKVLAVMSCLAIVTVGPALLLLLGVTFEGEGPDGPLNWAKVAGQIFLAGTGMAAVFAAVGLAVSSLTDRRAFASVAVVLVLFGSGAIVAGLVEGAEMSENLRVFNVVDMGIEVAPRIFGAAEGEGERGPEASLSDSTYLAGVFGWVGVSAAVLWARYRRIGAV